MRLLAISGSVRAVSSNTALLQAATELAPEGGIAADEELAAMLRGAIAAFVEVVG